MTIPGIILEIAQKLIKANYKAYLVGGCVRDLLLGIEPKDWDMATDALPNEILAIFPDALYENEFGTVGVKTGLEDEKLKIVEITTFRVEGKYSDFRHPDEVKFAKTIKEDLARRDFTVNALAMDLNFKKAQKKLNFKKHIIDPFDGQKDLKDKIIRAVLDPEKRFKEDALRLLRAVRFVVELTDRTNSLWKIEPKTREAIIKYAFLIQNISKERIRDELIKIMQTSEAGRGILMLEELGLLEFIIPELREGIGVTQNKHHIYTVFEHSVRALDYTAKKNYSLEVRFAALLHDIAKPHTKRGEGPDATFFGHEYLGAKMAKAILERLRFEKDFIKKVAHLIRYHMFYYNIGEVSEAGVRRFIKRVGLENIDDLIKVREADRVGSGVPKARVYKIRHLLYMIERVRRDPISHKMLQVNGNDVMQILNIPPGPKVGRILEILLEDVLDDPKRNTKEYLEERIKELGKLSDEELEDLAKKARQKKEEFEANIEKEMKKKYYV
jgi:poly(A) polymerase/tRNA nucleotidyltransferase (CCA-adding enzyme)